VRHDTPAAVSATCAVVADSRGRVQRIVEKPTDPPTTLKGCGVYLFDRRIFDVLRRTEPSPLYGNEREISVTVQMLIDEEHEVRAVCPLAWDVNVNRPEELLEANLRALELQGAANFTSRQASVSPDARLIHTVVGDGARVGAGVVLEECVLLEGTTVAAGSGAFRRTIFTPHGLWAASGVPAKPIESATLEARDAGA
jgi:dTDP-glucose pyrophosphorylase